MTHLPHRKSTVFPFRRLGSGEDGQGCRIASSRICTALQHRTPRCDAYVTWYRLVFFSRSAQQYVDERERARACETRQTVVSEMVPA